MKKRYLIMLSLSIIHSMFLTIPVTAKGMERKTIRPAEVANIGQLHNDMDVRSYPVHPCIMSRRFGYSRFGIPNGMYGCLYRLTQRFNTKFRW